MTQIALGSGWANWVAIGSASVLDGVMTATSTVGVSSRQSFEVAAHPGETYEFRCWARITDGLLIGNGALAIDHYDAIPGNDPLVRSVTEPIVSDAWREYVLRYTVPLGATPDAYIRFSAGVFTGGAGTCQFTWPSVQCIGGHRGTLRVVAAGLIGCSNGSWSIVGSYIASGIRSLSYANSALTLTVDRVPLGVDGAYPLGHVTKTRNGNAAWRRLIPTIGSYAAPVGARDGTVVVEFTDPSTGLKADAVAAIGTGDGFFNLTLWTL
ncbi:hypothetical protein [Pararhodobacter sp.]|uniref:hypothetical protein n=1 Tax=Pararhodobacter sp. TaxID=2127056 RepID=UPI002AFDCF3F|nr:hypothetical protein [Pararhodobacter sp.]